MPRIILHIGPEKCGSTSLQYAFSDPAGGLTPHVTGRVLDPYAVIALDSDTPAPQVLSAFRELIAQALAAAPDRPVILSHEMAYKSGPILRALARVAREASDDVRAIAYLRRQSDFLVSGFGQWHFRSPERLAEAAALLRRAHLDPALFWGIERHLIAVALGGAQIARQPSGHVYLDWAASVPERRDVLAAEGVALSVGVLPRGAEDTPLIEDFAQRAGLPVPPTGTPARNRSFHPALIEGTVSAIEAGMAMPGPHEANAFFRAARREPLGPPPDLAFVQTLKAHIDTLFADRNQQVVRAHGLRADYFAPERSVTLSQLRELLSDETARRTAGAHAIALHKQALASSAHAAWRHFESRAQNTQEPKERTHGTTG